MSAQQLARRWGWIGTFVVGGALYIAVLAVLAPTTTAAQEGEYAGEAVCQRCHPVYGKHYTAALHAKAFRLNPRSDLERRIAFALTPLDTLGNAVQRYDHQELLFHQPWSTDTYVSFSGGPARPSTTSPATS